MKYLKILGLAVLSAMALMAFASTASATTLEVGGVTKNESITITASLKAGTSAILRDTFGFSANTCTSSHVHGTTTSPYTGTYVTGDLTELTFGNCQHSVTVTNPGQLYIDWTSGTNGTVFSENAEVTTYSTIHGTYIHCETGTGTHIGTLTGVAAGNATLDVNATLTCGPHLHSAKWTGTYTVTTPGIGVSS